MLAGKAVPGKESIHLEVAIELKFCLIAKAGNRSSAT